MDYVSLQLSLSQSSKPFPGFREPAQTASPLEGKLGSGPDYPVASQRRYQVLDSCLVHPHSQPGGSSPSSLPMWNWEGQMQGFPNIWRHQRGQDESSYKTQFNSEGWDTLACRDLKMSGCCQCLIVSILIHKERRTAGGILKDATTEDTRHSRGTHLTNEVHQVPLKSYDLLEGAVLKLVKLLGRKRLYSQVHSSILYEA